MSISQLDKHDIIALDFDYTLLYHDKSVLLWRYIATNPDTKFYIITFRSGIMFKKLPKELEWETKGWITKKNFVDILSVGTQVYNLRVHLDSYLEGPAYMKEFAKSQLLDQGFSLEPSSVENLVEMTRTYKANLAKSLGATIMVDDDEYWVGYGCRKLGIEFVNSDDL